MTGLRDIGVAADFKDGLAVLIAWTHSPELQRARIEKRWGDKKGQGVALLREGLSVSEVARALNVSGRTVKRRKLTIA